MVLRSEVFEGLPPCCAAGEASRAVVAWWPLPQMNGSGAGGIIPEKE